MLCLVGLHRGDWMYADTEMDGECAQSRRECLRCGKLSIRYEHDWSDWDFEGSDLF